MSEALVRYVEQFPAFETTREHKFLTQLVTAFTSGEPDSLEKFTTAIQKWNNISPLDSWTAKQLIVVQRVLKGEVACARLPAFTISFAHCRCLLVVG